VSTGSPIDWTQYEGTGAPPPAASSTPQIDWSKYEAPAATETSAATPPRSWTDSLGDFASHLWAQVNPIAGVEGAAQLTAHPVDTLVSDKDARAKIYADAEKAFNSGQYGTGAAKLAYWFLPFIGPQLNQAADDFASGKIAAGLGTSTGMGLSAAAPDAIGDAVTRFPVGSIPDRLYRSALKPSTTLSAADAASMVKTGLEDAIPVSVAGSQKIASLIDDLNSQIKAQVASKPGATVNAFDVASRLNDTANKFRAQVNPTADLAAIRDSGAEFLSTNSTDIPVEGAQELKQGTYKQLNQRAYGELGTATTEAQKALARGLKEELQAQFPEIQGLNSHESQLIGLDEALEKRVSQLANKNLIPGGVTTGAAAGGIAGGVKGGATGAVLGVMKSLMDDPAIKSKLAIALNKGSNATIPIPLAATRVGLYSNWLGNAVQQMQLQPAQ
jgi:hypothetical protein